MAQARDPRAPFDRECASGCARRRVDLPCPPRMKPRQRALAWLFLVAYASLAALWAKGLVLCFEADGHVSIEAATADCSDCCAANGAASENEHAPGGPTLGNCACLDVALVGSFTPAKKSPAPELNRAPLAVGVPVRFTPRLATELRLGTDLPHSHASAALPFLSSVVLRV